MEVPVKEIFKNILDHGEIMMVKGDCARFFVDPEYHTCNLCAGW